MILHATISPTKPNNLISQLSSCTIFNPNGLSFVSFSYVRPNKCNVSSIRSLKTNSSSHMYGKRDVEDRGKLNWFNIYQKICNIEGPQMEVFDVFNKCENRGRVLAKWEVSKIVKELRKYKKFKVALQVYEWMNNRVERFRMSSSDTAIQLDLIAKVRGVKTAENYFARVPKKDKRVYGALLNVYAGDKIREKAEALMDQIRDKGFATHALPHNVMMSLYVKLDEFDKVEEIISEMKHKRIPLDSYSYNIWLSSCGSAEKMEQVFEEMDLNPTVIPNWSTFSTMASIYAKHGLVEKAEQCLRNVETRIMHRDKTPYHYLISLYGSLGNKEEVYRVWNIYKSVFPSIPNWGYHSVISSLVRLGDIEGAEKVYEEWLLAKVSYDPKIGNQLMGWYVKEEPFEKVKGFFDHIIEAGGKPNATSWGILWEGYIKVGKISEALACFKEASLAEGVTKWRPKPMNVKAFLELCDQEADQPSKEDFVALLTQMGCLQDEDYSSLLMGYGGTESTDKRTIFDCVADSENEETESRDLEMSLSIMD